ncbi:MAG: hypothetical protein NT080_07210 [Spirochaetes bacterium]|nr:hypothetical protein [Spirochaetota bacterium]
MNGASLAAILAAASAFAAACPAPLSADEFPPADFRPARRAPGDIVEAVFRYDPAGDPFDPSTVGIGPAIRGDDYDVLSVSASKNGSYCRIVVRIQPWIPGEVTTRPISAGGTIIPSFTLSVEPAVAVHGPGSPAFRDPLALPGTRIELLKIVAAIVVAAGAGGALAFRRSRLFAAFARRLRLQAAGRDFEKLLRRVEKLGEGEERRSWNEFAAGFRRYLSARSGLPVLAMTPREIAAVPESAIAAKPRAEAALALAAADDSRFGGRRGSVAGAMASARSVAAELEREGHRVVR